jgi:hypothetical protein
MSVRPLLVDPLVYTPATTAIEKAQRFGLKPDYPGWFGPVREFFDFKTKKALQEYESGFQHTPRAKVNPRVERINAHLEKFGELALKHYEAGSDLERNFYRSRMKREQLSLKAEEANQIAQSRGYDVLRRNLKVKVVRLIDGHIVEENKDQDTFVNLPPKDNIQYLSVDLDHGRHAIALIRKPDGNVEFYEGNGLPLRRFNEQTQKYVRDFADGHEIEQCIKKKMQTKDSCFAFAYHRAIHAHLPHTEYMKNLVDSSERLGITPEELVIDVGEQIRLRHDEESALERFPYPQKHYKAGGIVFSHGRV